MAEKLYPCDPSKNKECNKRGCYQNGGPCRSTTHAEYCDAGDLISKQALLYALDGIELIDEGDVDSNELESLIKRLPTIEAEPKSGRWVAYEFGNERWHKCSVCGKADEYINDLGLEAVRNYCPNCGARMDGGENG